MLQVVEDLRRIEAAHRIQVSWQEGASQFEDAFKRLCAAKQHLVQQTISRQVQLYRFISELYERVCTRRTDSKRLTAARERQKAAVEDLVCKWHRWRSSQSVIGWVPCIAANAAH